MITILVLDIATITGYCLVKITTTDTIVLNNNNNHNIIQTPTQADIYEHGVIHIDRSSNYYADHCLNLVQQVQQLIEKHQINHIAMEDYFFTQKTINNCTLNISLRTAIAMLARQNKMEYTMLNMALWKKFIADHMNPTKEQDKMWGKRAKKIFIQDALWKKFHIRFPNYSISKDTGKPVCFCYDVVDAVGQAIYFCGAICNIKSDKIKYNIITPSDLPSMNKYQQHYYY